MLVIAVFGRDRHHYNRKVQSISSKYFLRLSRKDAKLFLRNTFDDLYPDQIIILFVSLPFGGRFRGGLLFASPLYGRGFRGGQSWLRRSQLQAETTMNYRELNYSKFYYCPVKFNA